METRGSWYVPTLNGNTIKAVNFLWELKVPSNISLFGWRLILNRIPTKDQLIYRGVVVDNSCVLCGSYFESIAHLFRRYMFSIDIWNKVYDWIVSRLGMTVLELMEFFFHFYKVKVKSERIIIIVIWLATVWSLWLMQNGVMFRGASISFDEYMSSLMFLSWTWMNSSCNSVNNGNFFVWNSLPLLCFKR